jgi:flavodoxin
MNILVAFESHGGRTRQAAEAIAAAVRRQGRQVAVRPVADLQPADVQAADVLFLGTWVQGAILFGVGPARARQWVPALPALAGKPVGVFCTYAFTPRGTLRMLGSMLEARGAAVMGGHAFHRRQPGEGAEQFAENVLGAAGLDSP